MPWNTAGNIRGPQGLKGDKGDPGNAADIAALIHAAASKTPVDADELPLLDSAGAWSLRKFTWATLKSTLQSLFFYRGNIIGFVSQSGGTPTGAIVQRGSNSNGEFVRFADGTQICWHRWNVGGTSINVGALTNALVGYWTYPAAFINANTTSAYGNSAFDGGENFSCRLFCGAIEASVQIQNVTNSSRTAAFASTGVYIFAIGRWF